MADAVRLSEDYLIHVFRKTTGFSVKDYVMRLRMAIARRLLLETGATVEAISDRLGFADVSNFSRSFRAVGGLPPGAFRRAQTRALG